MAPPPPLYPSLQSTRAQGAATSAQPAPVTSAVYSTARLPHETQTSVLHQKNQPPHFVAFMGQSPPVALGQSLAILLLSWQLAASIDEKRGGGGSPQSSPSCPPDDEMTMTKFGQPNLTTFDL